jgi:CBS domain-containing protein
VTASGGDDPRAALAALAGDPLPYLLLVDGVGRPVGWLDASRIDGDRPLDASAAVLSSPLLDRRTTLKDALSMLLAADVQAGLVVDRDGRLQGMLTVDDVAERSRDAGMTRSPAGMTSPAGVTQV